MDEVRRRERDARGFSCFNGEARDEIGTRTRMGKKGQKGSHEVMVKKVMDEAKSEEGKRNKAARKGWETWEKPIN